MVLAILFLLASVAAQPGVPVCAGPGGPSPANCAVCTPTACPMGGMCQPANLVYTVLVGQQAGQYKVVGYFPSAITVHTCDTVVFQMNTMDISTITFAYGLPAAQQPFPTNIIPCPPPYNSTNTETGVPNYPVCYNPYTANPMGPAIGPAPCGSPPAACPPSGNCCPGGQSAGYAAGLWMGTTYINSGQASKMFGPFSPWMSVQFGAVGTFTYTDAFSNNSGTVTVISDPETIVPTPAVVSTTVTETLRPLLAKVPWVKGNATATAMAEVGPTINAFGTYTYNVMAGYNQDNIIGFEFFPSNLTIYSGDVVNFYLTSNAEAPHNVAMQTGLADPNLGLALPQIAPVPSPWSDAIFQFPWFGTVYVAINPPILFPQNPVGLPLAFAPPNFRYPVTNNATYFSSGFLATPAILGANARSSYAMQFAPTLVSNGISSVPFNGTINYQCDLHLMMGMVGVINVLPPPAVTQPVVYHMEIYTTQFGGFGCSPSQLLVTYTIPANVCFDVFDSPPFSQTIKALPATGPIATNGTTACTASNCVHILRWDLPTTLGPCFYAAPPDVSFVAPLDKSCVQVNSAMQVRMSSASRHVWTVLPAVVAVIAMIMLG